MGNVNMEAKQIHYRGGNKPMSVEEAIKEAGSSYVLPIASAETLGGVKVGEGLTIDTNGVLSADSKLLDYSTTEQSTGQKWIDGKDIYVRSWDFGEDISISNTDWTNLNILTAGMAAITRVDATSDEGGYRVVNLSISDQYVRALAARANGNFGLRYITLYYTKTN